MMGSSLGARFFLNRFRNATWRSYLAAAAVILACILLYKLLVPAAHTEPAQASIRLVEVRSVAQLASESTPLSIVGQVSSKSEASVRAESSGQVTGVYRNLGDTVGAGAVVAELSASSQRAALQQAQGVQAAAQAALDKVKKGTRQEQIDILETTKEGARSGALTALLGAYAAADSAVRGTADTYFSNPAASAPHFNIHTSNASVVIQMENKRVALGSVLSRESARSSSLAVSDDLLSEIDKTAAELREVRDFMDLVVMSLNAAITSPEYTASTISGYVTAATAARTGVSSAISALSGAKVSLETATSNLSQGVTGAQQEDIDAAEASLEQAKGAVAAARANLEKAIIRAPISGTINSFSLKQGDYVSLGQLVLAIANNRALEVVAFITQSDAREISIGQKVAIEGGASGVVTRIAPALDPVTKRIEVRVGVSDPGKTLTNGQSVVIGITRLDPAKVQSATRLTIPISAIKVEAQRITVFTVEENSTLKAHEVEIGALLGDRVEIKSGLTPDMEIVTDARGLREGQLIEVSGKVQAAPAVSATEGS